jgi:hypothetical protein
MKPELIIAIVGVSIALGGFLLTYFGFIADLKEKVGHLLAVDFGGLAGRVLGLETRLGPLDLGKMNASLIAIETKIGSVNLSELSTKMSIFWDSMEDILKGILHHPELEHKRKDMLLEKFPNLTVDEMCELRDRIKKEKIDMILVNQIKDRAYLLALGLMQARVETALVDLQAKCN